MAKPHVPLPHPGENGQGIVGERRRIATPGVRARAAGAVGFVLRRRQRNCWFLLRRVALCCAERRGLWFTLTREISVLGQFPIRVPPVAVPRDLSLPRALT